MIKLLAVTVVCVGIMCGGLYAQETSFIKESNDYKIMFHIKLEHEGVFMDDYSVTAQIIDKDHSRYLLRPTYVVNSCKGYVTCWRYPLEKQWEDIISSMNITCTESYPTVSDLLSDDTDNHVVFK
jgi:hypothetical protein